jgi:transposase
MIVEPQQPIWLCTQPVDMRKSFDGLMGLIANQLRDNPSSKQFYVFINRRKTHIKIFYFDGSGYCIWCKRLEQGQFNRTSSSEPKQLLDWLSLRLLLDGIEMKKVKQYKRFSL